MNNKILYSLIAATFVVGLFTAAYAGITLPMITLAGDVTITGDMTCPGCVDRADIAPNAVGPVEIAFNAVSSSKIADGSIRAEDLAPGVGVPIGTVLSWTGFLDKGTTLPTGYLFADGSSLLRTDFPALFNLIGTIYGEGSDRLRETTFSLPDLRNTFIRGTTVNLGVTGGTVSHNHIDDPPNVAIAPGGAHTHPVNPPTTTSGFPLEENKPVSLAPLTAIVRVADDDHRHNVNIPTFDSGSTTHTHNVNIGPHPTETAANEPPFLSLSMIIRAK